MASIGRRSALMAIGLLLFQEIPAGAIPPTEEPASVTVPFVLDHNRTIVEVEFRRPDGSTRKAQAWLDTGGQDLMVAEPLARDLSTAATLPGMRLGGLTLDIEGLKTKVRAGSRVMPGLPAEVSIPARALRKFHLVLDYPARRLTLARPGSLKPRGTGIPCRVNPETGLFLIAAILDGETVQMGVDTGSAGTWVSDKLTSAWTSRHPDWVRCIGAAGSANFFGFDFEPQGTLMRLPELGLGPLKARNVALLGLDQSLFDWYSKKSAGPLQGFIGANVLRGFRLEIDFKAQMSYWEAAANWAPEDLDIVGLCLRPEGNGSMVIAGVVQKNGKPMVEGIQAGDRLLQVGSLPIQDSSMGAVIDALRGKPGESRTLLLERNGKRFSVDAKVGRLP